MRSYWCPACGCDNSKWVKAEVKALVKALAVKGGKARAAKMSPERRREIASLGGKAKAAKRSTPHV